MHRPKGLPGFFFTCSILTCSILLSPIVGAAPALASSAPELALSTGLELPNARSIDPIVAEMFPRWTSVRIYLNGEHRSEPAIAELAAWAQAMRGEPVTTRLRAINEKVNDLLSYTTDMQLWHETDYWETPGEAVARGAADCEGYAILKMYLAKEAGIPLDQMAILVGALGYARAPHAVLGAKVGQVVVTLDNKTGSIVALGDRSDFTPIYSVGVRGAYTYPMNWNASAGASSTASPTVWTKDGTVTSADSNAHAVLRPASAAPIEVDADSDDTTETTAIAATNLDKAAVDNGGSAMPIPPVKPSANRVASNPPPSVVAEPATVVASEEMPESDIFGSIDGKLEQVVSFLFR
jgi:predicted transglutaminase-like cysteine proteinase